MNLVPQLLKRRAVIATVAAGLILLLVWWFAWMRPSASSLTSLRSEQSQSVVTRSALITQLTELQQDARHAASAKAYLGRFGAAVPATADAPGLVVDVYNLATSDGVKLSSITDNTIVTNSGYSTIPVSIAVNGAQDSVLRFVKGLYGITRLVTVQAVSLSGPGDVTRSSGAATTATISATAYTLAVPAQPALAN